MQQKDVEQEYLALVEKTKLENEQIKADNRKQLEDIEKEYHDENNRLKKIYDDITIPYWENECENIKIDNVVKSKESDERKKYVKSYNEKGEHINSHGVKIYSINKDLLTKLQTILSKSNIKYSYILFDDEDFKDLADFVVNNESDFKQIGLYLDPDSMMVYVAETGQKDFVKKEKYRYKSLLNPEVSYTLLEINQLSKDLEKKKFITLSHTPYKPLALPHKPVYTAPEKRKAQLKELLNEPMIQTNEYVGIMKNGKLTKLNNTNKLEHQQIVVVESTINGNQAFFALLDALYNQFKMDLAFGGADRIKLILIDFLQNLAKDSSKDEANQFYQDIVITYLDNKQNKKDDTNTGTGVESSN